MCPHSNLTTCYHCLSAPRTYIYQSSFHDGLIYAHHSAPNVPPVPGLPPLVGVHFIQPSSDLMAILPYPVAPPKNPQGKDQKKDGEKKDGNQNNQNQNKQGNKAPAGIPSWSAYMPPQGMVMGGPSRPLPVPGLNMIPGVVPAPPPPSFSVSSVRNLPAIMLSD
ncbi:hypothetical protein M231_02076 [Tremella mesenterica]|uniref:Uncharacterized protein n=1 Tax=Tremella mesenterica TaxID=5217 RepID=A0A4Q1BRL3_TREME|nr:hypothetical protein M231_02076 [Tremella mesenterica]